ncbi:MAG: hypothetical protein ABJH07_16930 [Sedimentitalea sp.]|uniref:hypothetical protein n=1 Tax=Sedimentitalea sp. TaxID=2048915 RepID=UPI00326487DD
MFFRDQERFLPHLFRVIVAATFSAMLLIAAPVRADDSTDVTFFTALEKLASAAGGNRRVTSDNLEGYPYKTTSLQLTRRIREEKTNTILWGFGNEMVSAFSKILAVGGAAKTAEIVGLIKDAANSRSLADFVVKAGPKKAWKSTKDHFKALGETDANAERLANKALDQLFKKMQLVNRTKRVVSSTTTGLCNLGSERLTVDLNVAKGEVVLELQASGCTCSRKDDLKAYSGKVAGSFDPSTSQKKIKWGFKLRTSNFSVTPCDPRQRALSKIREKSRKKGVQTAPLGTAKPNQCTAGTCIFLIKHLDLKERQIQELACRRAGLKRKGREQSDEYKTLAEEWERSGKSLTGLYGEYVSCKCDRVADVPKKLFELRGFREALARSGAPPYRVPELPVKDKDYCSKCDPYRSWIGKWSMWGSVEISLRNGAVHFDWKTTYKSANPIKTKVTFASATKLNIDYEMSGNLETGTLELTLQPGGRQFHGIRIESGLVPIPRFRTGDRIGDRQHCVR